MGVIKNVEDQGWTSTDINNKNSYLIQHLLKKKLNFCKRDFCNVLNTTNKNYTNFE